MLWQLVEQDGLQGAREGQELRGQTGWLGALRCSGTGRGGSSSPLSSLAHLGAANAVAVVELRALCIQQHLPVSVRKGGEAGERSGTQYQLLPSGSKTSIYTPATNAESEQQTPQSLPVSSNTTNRAHHMQPPQPPAPPHLLAPVEEVGAGARGVRAVGVLAQPQEGGHLLPQEVAHPVVWGQGGEGASQLAG